MAYRIPYVWPRMATEDDKKTSKAATDTPFVDDTWDQEPEKVATGLVNSCSIFLVRCEAASETVASRVELFPSPSGCLLQVP